jgi:hypothetical protein
MCYSETAKENAAMNTVQGARIIDRVDDTQTVVDYLRDHPGSRLCDIIRGTGIYYQRVVIALAWCSRSLYHYQGYYSIRGWWKN